MGWPSNDQTQRVAVPPCGDQRWRALVEHLEEFITVISPDGTVIYDTPGKPGELGYPAEEFVGQNVFALLHPDDTVRTHAAFQELLAQPGATRHLLVRARAKNGTWRTLEITGTNRLADPAIGGIVLNTRDVTDSQQTEQALRDSEARYRAVVEAFDGLIYICSPEYRVEFMNQRLIARTGRNAVGERCYRALHNRRAICPWCVNDRVFAGATVRWEVESPKDHRWYHIINTPIRHADGSCSKLAMILDITPRKQVEAALRQARAELEQRVRDRTAALERANRSLRAVTDCHEALLRATSETELLQTICRIIVATGKQRMAWVGFAEHDPHKTVRPVAEAGLSRQFLTTAKVCWANVPRGRGPAGTAIRTGKTTLCRNTATDPRFAPWRALARRLGFGSVIALPLIAGAQRLGALTIYAAQPDAFDAADQQLLQELARDLTFGILTLRLRAEHQHLEQQLLNISEREQRRIGHDLHDSVGQHLTAITYLASSLTDTLTEHARPEAAEAARIARLLTDTVAEVRALSHGLQPVAPEPHGLMSALAELAASVRTIYKITCRFSCNRPVLIHHNHVATHLYRIAQEAVHNALAHARPRHLWIRLHRTGHHCRLTIRSDGRQPPAKPGPHKGLGREIMQYRAHTIGATLKLSRHQTGGLLVACSWTGPPHHRSTPRHAH